MIRSTQSTSLVGDELRAAVRLIATAEAADNDEECERLAARVVWSTLVEPGDSVATELCRAMGEREALSLVSGRTHGLPGGIDDDALPTLGLPAAVRDGLARWRPRLDERAVVRRLEVAARLGVSLMTPSDPDWPAAIDDLGSHSPFVLWVRGDRAALSTAHAVAVVGARASTGYGEHVAAEITAGLAEGGVTVVSGGAFGIDGVTHRTALAVGGSTVAFLAGGIDRLYPAAHSGLLERMIAQPASAVVSELPPGESPTRWRFLQRNRLIAACSEATVVVEAGARSGSLNTAGHASALGRPLGAVPGPVTSGTSTGCHRLLREFDATCVTGSADVLELIGRDPSGEPSTERADTAGSGSRQTSAQTRVLDGLSVTSSRDAETVARATGLSMAETSAVLGELLLIGAVRRTEDGAWRRMRRR